VRYNVASNLTYVLIICFRLEPLPFIDNYFDVVQLSYSEYCVPEKKVFTMFIFIDLH